MSDKDKPTDKATVDTSDADHLTREFLQQDQPNRGKLFRDFISQLPEKDTDSASDKQGD